MPEDLQTPTTAGRFVEPQLRAEMRRVQDEQPIDSGGGATLTKVLVLADLIVSHDLHTVVELGVYRGRLLLPLGRLLAGLGRGEAIGIDPYSAQAAIQTDAHAVGFDLPAWALEQNWEGLQAEVAAAIDRWQLGGHMRLVRERSLDAVGRFPRQSIDLLHVDGNHDAVAVAADVEAYLPAIRQGGFVVLDDASWTSVLPQIQRLTDEQRLVFRLFDVGCTLDELGANDFAVFQIVNERSSTGAADPPASRVTTPGRQLRSRLRRFRGRRPVEARDDQLGSAGG